MVCGLVLFQERISGRHVFQRNWTVCSRYELQSQYDQGGGEGGGVGGVGGYLYDQLMSTTTFHFDDI